jgi:hypothetical protein
MCFYVEYFKYINQNQDFGEINILNHSKNEKNDDQYRVDPSK